jgi:hypothetical protein
MSPETRLRSIFSKPYSERDALLGTVAVNVFDNPHKRDQSIDRLLDLYGHESVVTTSLGALIRGYDVQRSEESYRGKLGFIAALAQGAEKALAGETQQNWGPGVLTRFSTFAADQWISTFHSMNNAVTLSRDAQRKLIQDTHNDPKSGVIFRMALTCLQGEVMEGERRFATSPTLPSLR